MNARFPVTVVEGALPPEGPSLLRAMLDDPALLAGVEPGMRVAVKASFMRGTHHEDRCPIVDPQLLGVLCESLVERGATVQVVELPNGWGRVLENRSVASVARYFGFEGPYTVVDDPQTWELADFRIVFGKLASHPRQEFVGCVHAKAGLQAAADLALLDAYKNVADGVVGTLGCAWPATPFRLYAGPSAVAVDAAVAWDLGLPSVVNPMRKGIDRALTDWRGPRYSRRTRALARLVPLATTFPDWLWVPRADSTAFPASSGQTVWAQRAARWVLGLKTR